MGTWVAGAIVFCLLGLAIRQLYKDHKHGKRNGCNGCSCCSGGLCDGKPEDSRKRK